MSRDWTKFPAVKSAEVQRTNERLLQALLPHAYAEAALYLRQLAESIECSQSNGSAEHFNRRNVAGALLLAAEALKSSDAAWHVTQDNEYGRLERASFHIKEGN